MKLALSQILKEIVRNLILVDIRERLTDTLYIMAEKRSVLYNAIGYQVEFKLSY